MFHSIALDVVIGLIFIYLLYSLLATVLSEIIASMLGLRARNLREAIDRMLHDEKITGFFNRLWDSFRLMKNPRNNLTNRFYQHPEIKYLGGSGLFRTPSWISAASFSKTIICVLFGQGTINKETIERKLEEIAGKTNDSEDNSDTGIKVDPETAAYILSLWKDAEEDVQKFRDNLESWFDKTMDQASEWYKRKIRIILLILGFVMAWFFNADTFSIVRKLSVDKSAREEMVSMVNAYIQNNRIAIDTAMIKDAAVVEGYSKRLDSLLAVKKQLESDMEEANTLLGSGGWLPDTVFVLTDPATRLKSYSPGIDAESLSAYERDVHEGKIGFGCKEKTRYLFRLAYHHFIGFLITAIAISLGAPFWFDLLNKLMQLRTSKKA